MQAEEQLKLISLAWGKQDGYCFFPWIDGDAKDKQERIQGYHEGPAFHWPHDKAKIIAHLKARENDDLYWCPSLFETPRRSMDQAMDEHALWADLDEVDPRSIETEFKPTIAWQTSPGRFQALWLISRGFDIQGASWAGGENQRLTYYLHADPSGWDSTQLLRIPGWSNHKPEYRNGKGVAPRGKLLWYDKARRYLPDHFEDLPEVDSATAGIRDVLEEEINRVDRHAVWGRVRLKVSKIVREYIAAREISGDRSEVLWQIERELADAGCSVTEIVAIVRATAWNKYAGRADELRRLTNEAAKAVAARPDEVAEQLEAESNRPRPTRFGEAIRDIKPPDWLVDGIWARGACGFIAGQPKSFKSWCGLDLAFSVASGADFLGQFSIATQGPVLYIQEEDGLPILKQRAEKVWPSKQVDRMIVSPGGGISWESPKDLGDMAEVPLDSYVGEGFEISDPSWQAWLDDTITEGEYVLVVMDPFMMMAGDVEENQAQKMTTKVFRPLKQLAQKHNTSIALVHHMRKADPKSTVRGGQLMLGSVANHAWAEDSLYLRLTRGEIVVETESKHATSGSFKIGNLRNKQWMPLVKDLRMGDEEYDDKDDQGEVRIANKSKGRKKGSKSLQALEELGKGAHSTAVIAETAGLTNGGVYNQLKRAEEAGQVIRPSAGKWQLVEKS